MKGLSAYIGKNDVAEILRSIHGQPACRAVNSVGSVIGIDFGLDQAPATRGPGRLALWVFEGSWRISLGAALVVACEDDRSMIATGIAKMDGRRVVGTAIGGHGDLCVDFEGGLRLATFTAITTDTELAEPWVLYLPDNLLLRPDPPRFYLGPSSE